MTKQDLIDALSSQYGEDSVSEVIDGMIEKEGLDGENLPDDFGDKVIDCFIIMQEQQNSLPSSTTGSQITVTRPNAVSIQKAQSLGISQEMLDLTACIVLENSTEEINKILDARDQVIQRQVASRNLELVKQISIGTFTEPEHYKKLAIEYGLIEDPESQQKEQNNFLQMLVEERELKKKKRQQEAQAKKQKEQEKQQQRKDKESELLARFYQSLRNTPID